MAHATYDVTRDGKKGFTNGYLFGAPVRDLGIFATVIMGLATGMCAFFLATFVGIVSILIWNANGHKADFAMSYRLVGLPVGAVVMVCALAYLGTFWAKRVLRKG